MNWHSFWTRSAGTGGRLALAAALAAAAGGETLAGRAALASAPVPAAAGPAAQNPTVQIYGDRLDPAQITLEVASTVTIDLVNYTGEDCTFYIESYLSDLLVPAGGTARNGFVVSDLPPPTDQAPGAATGCPSDSGSVEVPMGCRGVASQQGSAVVQRQPGT